MNKEQILYEDNDIIVCYKPAGIATQTDRVGQRDMVSEVTNYLVSRISNHSRANCVNDIYTDMSNVHVGGSNMIVRLVHRLDQPVEGILVFGKNQKAAGALSRQIVENRMEKDYYAAVSGRKLSGMPASEGMRMEKLTDYLLKDNKGNMSCVVPPGTKGAKKAVLEYEVLEKKALVLENCSEKIQDGEGSRAIALIQIRLITGRHHQIRAQMSHAGISLLGDYKYADEQTKKLSDDLGQKQIALCAYRLAFAHPVTGKRLSFQKNPEGRIFQNFSI
ncbi:MAG: RluA family pseudouridine synthase [Blautia sp.]|nr:RluA family pseudouridine synthase [Blautia sp.]MCM1200325.1 RluA family pseudouridine synthase [Bacteroides fragilis]